MHKRLKGISILNGDVMGAPVQNGTNGAVQIQWFGTDIATLWFMLLETSGENFTKVNIDSINVVTCN